MNPTIKDVAKLANTSKSTVSRYLNGRHVKRETEEALKSAIKELRYHPNINARRLVQNRTQVIGVVADDISNPFYSGILKGIETMMKSRGYRCVFYSATSSYKTEVDTLELAQERQVDGLILISFFKRPPELFERIREMTIPIALIGDAVDEDGIFSIDIDNQFGIIELVQYLYRIGHRKIAFIAGPDKLAATACRTQGYETALKDLDLEFNEDWIAQSDWSKEGGYKAMGDLLKVGGFTAVVSSNDESAVGAYLYANELGYRIPRDFSIVGFDDIEVSQWIYPTLTTVRQPMQQMGQKVAEGLIGKLEMDTEPAENRVLIKPKLIVRNSCMNLL